MTHTQLFGREKSWNLKDTSPAVSLCNIAPDLSSLSYTSTFLGACSAAGVFVRGGGGDGGGIVRGVFSQRKTWRRIGRRAWR